MNIEDIVGAVETQLLTTYATYLATIEQERNDGLRLEPIAVTEWEELDGALTALPAALILGDSDVDVDSRDQIIEVNLTVNIILQDRAKQHLTKKLYRYGDALRRLFRPANARTLNQRCISVKVTTIKYSPTFTDSKNLYTRDLQAELAIRMSTGR